MASMSLRSWLLEVVRFVVGLFVSLPSRQDVCDRVKARPRRVCVMGAGASGLVTLKELLDEGHDAECFEASDFIGGAFSVGQGKSEANRVYSSMYLTISNAYMAFSDFPPKDNWRFWRGIDYAHYLQDYAEHFRLLPRIQFGVRVVETARDDGPDGAGWQVTTVDRAGRRRTQRFDALAVSIGSHQHPNMPDIPGLSTFQGPVEHSFNFASEASGKWRGKRPRFGWADERDGDI